MVELDREERQLNTFPKPTIERPLSKLPGPNEGLSGTSFVPQIKKAIIRKTHTDFQTAGTTKDVSLFSIPKYAELITSWFEVIVAFAGTGIATYTISTGKDTAETGIQTAQSVATTGLKLAMGTDFTANRAIYSSSASTVIQARATSTGANLDQSTAGIVDFHFTYIIHGEANL